MLTETKIIPPYLKDVIAVYQNSAREGVIPSPGLLTDINGALWRYWAQSEDLRPISVDVPEFPLSQTVIVELSQSQTPQVFIWQPAITSSRLLELMKRLAYGGSMDSRQYDSWLYDRNLKEQLNTTQGVWVCVDSGTVPPNRNLNEEQTRYLFELQQRVGVTAFAYIAASRFFEYAGARILDFSSIVPLGSPFDTYTQDPQSDYKRERPFRSRLLGFTIDNKALTARCNERAYIEFSNSWDPGNRNHVLGARSMKVLG